MKILLLEDDIILNELVEEFLISLGHNVRCEYDGLEALDTIFENNFDLLLLDVGTPTLSGFELLQELAESRHERIAAQARRALVNLGKGNKK